MSSKRGRKRNDNLPPNRARDVQRAFRARRAAHLQALEQRVSELEAENGCLRQALNLPPSNRPALGKGPTGKDKPKLFEPPPSGSQSLALNSSHDSSSADSPASRGSSQSPGFPGSMSASRPLTVIDPGSWNDSLLLNTPQHQLGEGPSNSGQPYLAPMPAPMPLKPLQYPPYPNTLPLSSRPVSNNEVYIPPSNQFGHPPDRPLSASYPQPYTLRGDINDDARTHYNYTPTHSFASSDPNMHSDSPPPSLSSHTSQTSQLSQSAPSHTHISHSSSHNVPHISQSSLGHIAHNPPPHISHPSSRVGHQGSRVQPNPQASHTQSQAQLGTPRDSPMPYPHRRSVTESHTFSLGQGFPHLPNPASFHHDNRPGDYFRQQDNLSPSPRSNSMYGSDGRPNHPP